MKLIAVTSISLKPNPFNNYPDAKTFNADVIITNQGDTTVSLNFNGNMMPRETVFFCSISSLSNLNTYEMSAAYPQIIRMNWISLPPKSAVSFNYQEDVRISAPVSNSMWITTSPAETNNLTDNFVSFLTLYNGNPPPKSPYDFKIKYQ